MTWKGLNISSFWYHCGYFRVPARKDSACPIISYCKGRNAELVSVITEVKTEKIFNLAILPKLETNCTSPVKDYSINFESVLFWEVEQNVRKNCRKLVDSVSAYREYFWNQICSRSSLTYHEIEFWPTSFSKFGDFLSVDTTIFELKSLNLQTIVQILVRGSVRLCKEVLWTPDIKKPFQTPWNPGFYVLNVAIFAFLGYTSVEMECQCSDWNVLLQRTKKVWLIKIWWEVENLVEKHVMKDARETHQGWVI